MTLAEIEKDFDRQFDHYNPIHDDGKIIPVWTGGDYKHIKQFLLHAIEQAFKETTPKKIPVDISMTNDGWDGYNFCMDKIQRLQSKFMGKEEMR